MATWSDLTDSFNNDQQIEEMRKKYENCYLHVRTKEKEPVLCVYKGWDGDYHRFSDLHGMDIRLRHDTNTEVVCSHPEKGLFNTPNRMFYYYRLPNRQYRRGVCKDNCQIVDPVYELWTQKSFFRGEILQYAYKSTYYDIQTVIQKLRKKEASSLALDINFGITLSVTSDHDMLFLWYHDSVIGHITTKDVVVIKNAVFEQEVIDNIKLFHPYTVEFHAK